MSGAEQDPKVLLPARPGGVVRLSRRGLWAIGCVVVLVGVAAIVALQAQGKRASEARLASLAAPSNESRWYEKESDAVFTPAVLPTAAPTPRVEAALPVSLAEKAPEKDPLQARRTQAYIRALDAKTLVPEVRTRASRRGEEGNADRALPSSATPSYPVGGTGAGLTEHALDPNLQERKERFLRLDGRAEVLASELRASRSPFEVKAGSVIPAILVSGIDSDLPGQTIAQVRENVFDTASGSSLLLPQGTRVIGLYDSHVAYGQERVLVRWKRLVFPNGTSLSLKDGMPGADSAGAAGFSDEVDNHLAGLFGRAILLSAITTGVELSQRGFQDRGGFSVSAPDVASASLGQNLGQVASEVIRRGLDRQPTLVVRPGYRFNIMVTEDLVLPGPYADDSQTTGRAALEEKETIR